MKLPRLKLRWPKFRKRGTAAPVNPELEQVKTAWLSAIATVVALAISVYTLIHQQQLDRDQTTLNTFAKTREERKYSSRIAIWAVAGEGTSSVRPGGLDVSIQNRSPVPARNVRVAAALTGGGPAVVSLTDIPPCTIEKHRIAPPAGRFFKLPTNGIAGYDRLQLEFAVDYKTWVLDSDALAEKKLHLAAGAPQLIDRRISTEDVGDCGEGG